MPGRERTNGSSQRCTYEQGCNGLCVLVNLIRIEEPVRRYIVCLARTSRQHPDLQVGASPRAVEHMGDAVRAWALLAGRDYVLPDDVKTLAEPVFAHRIVPSTDARIRGRTAEELLEEVVRGVEVPVEFGLGQRGT